MDSRDREASRGPWYTDIDESKMLVTVTVHGEDDDDNEFEDDVQFPFTYEACELCGGKGKHVNPSIDAHGISQEEFDDDPEFEESYFSGAYDTTCYRCHGKRVEPMLDEKEIARNPALNKMYELWLSNQEDDARYESERESERRMGC